MGRAERHAGNHKPTTLQVAVDAARLHHHTCLIMRNPKFFNPEHDFSSMTLVNKERRGEAPRGALEESYRCVRACMEKGNSRRLLRNMDNFYNQLKGEIEYGKAA